MSEQPATPPVPASPEPPTPGGPANPVAPVPVPAPAPKASALPLAALVIALIAAAGLGVFGYQQYRSKQEIGTELAAAKAASEKLDAELHGVQADLFEARTELQKTKSAHDATLAQSSEEKARLNAELQQKAEATQALEAKLAVEKAAKEEPHRREEAARVARAAAVEEARVAEEAKAKVEKARVAEEGRRVEEAEKPKRDAQAVKAAQAARETIANSDSYRASKMQGLWETVIAGMKKSERARVKEIELHLGGVKEKLTAQYYLQDKSRPLVIIINGTFSKGQNVYAEELERVFIRSGCSILTFDSFFSRRFLNQTQIAPPGNLKAEAVLAGRIVEAFLKQSGIRENVSEIAAVGLSYGGGVVLQMALLDQAHQLPFTLSRVQAYSVPINFREAMLLLDGYEAHPYSYDTILPIVMKANKNSKPPSDATAEMLEKVIGRGFRLDLPETVEIVDRLYYAPIKKARPFELKTNYLGDPHADTLDRQGEAQSVSFKELFEDWLAPYWQSSAHVSPEELMDMGDIAKMLPELDARVQIILARNDPLNVPGAIEALEKIPTKAKLTVLPTGGHLGFLETESADDIAASLFPSVSHSTDKQKK